MLSLGLIIGVIQGVREALEEHRDNIGTGDLFLACASLEWAEGELFELWDEPQGLRLEDDIEADIIVA